MTRKTWSLLALALIVVAVVVPGPDRTAQPLRAQSENPCEARVDKQVAPRKVVIGNSVAVTMSVVAACASLDLPVHAVLAVDNSLSMGGPRMGDLRDAVPAFVDELDLTRSRVGVLTFYGFVDILTELTQDIDVLSSVGDAFFPRRGSDHERALRGAHDIITRGRQLPGADQITEVIVLMSGSDPQGEDDALRAAATRIKDDGILLITVALTGDADFQLLEELSSSPEQFYIESEGILYPELLRTVAKDTSAVRLEGAEFTERLPESLELVWGSDSPPARPNGDTLLWAWSIWPTEGITITYELEPQQLGTFPVSRGATVELRFDRGAPRTLDFPVPEIEVVPPPSVTPTATTTPTPTATPTATPVLRPAYMPIALRNHCKPDPRGADFVLLLDASSSMLQPAAEGAPKLQLATLAGSRFVDALRLPADRAAVVAFRGSATPLVDLTGSRGALQVALGKLFGMVGTGSRIDLGIMTGQRMLAARGLGAYPGPLPPRWTAADRRQVMVILTDGLAEPESARQAAAEARKHGVIIYTVGLGGSVDSQLLIDIAGDASRFRPSADGADLEAIYLEIARDPGCP